MAIKRTFNGATIIKPGAYSKIVVENLTGFPLQPTGTVGIVGEAVGGEPRVLDILSGTGIQDAKARYKSGPIADALELLANPTNDPRIANGASTIVVYKTNGGTQSALTLQDVVNLPNGNPTLDLTSKNWGDDENQVGISVAEGAIEDTEAFLTGTIAGPYTLLGSDTLVMNDLGNLYTYTSSLGAGSFTAQQVADNINLNGNWAPSRPIFAEVVAGGVIKITRDTAQDVDREYGLINVDATSTLDTILGLSGAAWGERGSKIFTLVKGTFEEVSPDLGGLKQLGLLYTGAGTYAEASIVVAGGETRFQTAVTGGPGTENLDIVLVDSEGRNKHTIKSLADLINSLAGGVYTATVEGSNPSLNANQLDVIENLPIVVTPNYFKNNHQVFIDWFNTFSTLASAKIAVGYQPYPSSLETFSTPRFFTGATDGTSTNLDFANGFEALKEERINIVVPLISKDIGALTVDSINAIAAQHAIWGWSTLGKSERHAFVSKNGSKAVVKDAARAINSGYTSLVAQQPRVLNNLAELTWMDEWAYACLCAGQRAGAEVGEPLTFKLFNANDLRVADGSWNPKKDFAEMIEAGVWVGEPLDTGGFRHVVGNTTYGVDPNFVWNRESVVQAAGFVAYDLRFNLELVFTGTKARTGTAEAIANFIKNRMSTYLGADIIVGDDLNEGLGYKNLRVNVEGNTAIINVSVTPVQGIDFLLPTIYLADIRQSA